MSFTRARVVLIVIFGVGLVTQIVAAVLTYRAKAITSSELNDLIIKLLAIYSVHLAVIFAGVFVKQQGGRAARMTPTVFWLASALALLWNLLLAWRTVGFAVAAYDPEGEDSIGKLVSYLEGIASASSFLVVGALAFIFTKKESG